MLYFVIIGRGVFFLGKADWAGGRLKYLTYSTYILSTIEWGPGVGPGVLGVGGGDGTQSGANSPFRVGDGEVG